MSSHRQILRSSAIIGGSTVIAVAIAIVKVKALAVVLGATGVGLMGIFQNIMGVTATLASCGLATSGVRQLASSHGAQATLDTVRHALLRGNFLLGLIGGVLLWLSREPVSYLVFKDYSHSTEVGLLGAGVWLTLLAGSQTALLQGLRHIGKLAKVSIVGSIFAAVTGIGFAYWLGIDGVIWFVIAAPLSVVIAGAWYAAKLPKPVTQPAFAGMRTQLMTMLKLGIPFMLTGLLTLATQFAARTIIVRELGLDSAGHFQASWAISMQYIGFVLGAMSTDYYPRLSGVIADPQKASILVAEQTEMALLLAIPALLAMITLAPVVIYLLYSSGFEPATELLRWQSVGNFLKVASWPMGFIMLAQARGGWFILTESVWNVSYLIVLFWGIPMWGLDAAGYGFALSYLLYFAILIPVSRKLLNYRVRKLVWGSLIFMVVVGLILIFCAKVSPWLSLAVGTPLTMVVGWMCLRRIDNHVDLRGWLKKRFHPPKPNGSTDSSSP